MFVPLSTDKKQSPYWLFESFLTVWSNNQLNFVGPKVGGTWFWNTYPGVGCDVVSHLYSFSFFRNARWTKSYSLGDEILKYISFFSYYNGLDKHVELKTKVLSTEWDKNKQKWIVHLDNIGEKIKKIEEYSWIISGIGGLHIPTRPKFPGKFSGIELHSAEWDSRVDFKGKKVALIGTGASSIQLLPKLINEMECQTVTMFQRTAPFIFPRLGSPILIIDFVIQTQKSYDL